MLLYATTISLNPLEILLLVIADSLSNYENLFQLTFLLYTYAIVRNMLKIISSRIILRTQVLIHSKVLHSGIVVKPRLMK